MTGEKIKRADFLSSRDESGSRGTTLIQLHKMHNSQTAVLA